MKILLSRSGGLGDCLLTLPLAMHIKNTFPGSSLHLLGNPVMCAVARLSGLFNTYHSIEDRMFAKLFYGFENDEELRTFFTSYDKVVFFSTGDKVSLEKNILAAGAGECKVIDPRPLPGTNSHITCQLIAHYENCEPEDIQIPQEYGLPVVKPGPELHMELVIHQGSGGVKKNWPRDNFLSIAEKSDLPVSIVLGPAELERGEGRFFRARQYAIKQSSSLTELQEILKNAAVMLGNDSGVTHFSAAMKVPTVALFGPTDASVWHPLGDTVNVIVSSDRTMDGIDENDVLEVMNMIQKS